MTDLKKLSDAELTKLIVMATPKNICFRQSVSYSANSPLWIGTYTCLTVVILQTRPLRLQPTLTKPRHSFSGQCQLSRGLDIVRRWAANTYLTNKGMDYSWS